jgi:hypothetical protein
VLPDEAHCANQRQLAGQLFTAIRSDGASTGDCRIAVNLYFTAAGVIHFRHKPPICSRDEQGHRERHFIEWDRGTF